MLLILKRNHPHLMSHYENFTYALLMSFTILFCFASFLAGKKAYSLWRELLTLRRSKEYFDKTYLQKTGSTATYVPPECDFGEHFFYDLRSFDGGNTWYAVKEAFAWGEITTTQNRFVKILGEAEVVYPGLLENITAWDELIAHAKKNGAVTANDIQGKILLERIGFKIDKK